MTSPKLELIRKLRKAPIKKPRKRFRAQLQPDAIRLAYYKAIKPFFAIASAAFRSVRPAIVSLVESEKEALTEVHDEFVRGVLFKLRHHRWSRNDVDRKEEARRLLNAAAEAAAKKLRGSNLPDVAERYAKRTNDFQRDQFNEQLKDALTVSLPKDLPTYDRLAGFTKENVDLIKTAHERYFDRIEAKVLEAFETGKHVETLTAELQEIDDMLEESDARRIARDQIGKLMAQYNQDRQRALGCEKYTWRTVNDERVRDEHGEREGLIFSWDDPPEDGHPGEAIQCRCSAEPIFDELFDED